MRPPTTHLLALGGLRGVAAAIVVMFPCALLKGFYTEHIIARRLVLNRVALPNALRRAGGWVPTLGILSIALLWIDRVAPAESRIVP